MSNTGNKVQKQSSIKHAIRPISNTRNKVQKQSSIKHVIRPITPETEKDRLKESPNAQKREKEGNE
jgi:hypothetical protein